MPPDPSSCARKKRRFFCIHPLLGRYYIRLVLVAVVVLVSSHAWSAPIQRVQGVITYVGEGYLLLKADDGTGERKFILRWKARFIPPKLPLEGDRVLILYKDKAAGAIIYGVEYLGMQKTGERGRGKKNRLRGQRSHGIQVGSPGKHGER